MKKTFFLLMLMTTIFSCSKEVDPCEGIICENGGSCFNGVCECTDSYEGAACQNEKIPASITITSITVTRMPSNNGGLNWDVLNGPDLIIFFYKQSNDGTILDRTSVIENADTNQSYTFSNLSFKATTPDERYVIRLFDSDGNADDFMGGVNFVPYKSNQGFPTGYILDADDNVAFDVEISYEFD